MSEFIKFEKFEGYAVLKFNRPERKNAVKKSMYWEIIRHLKESENDDAINLLVVTGEGEYFSSGADMYDRDYTGGDLRKYVTESLQPFKQLVISLINFTKPIIAAVNGPAIGVGVTMLGHCDVIYASDSSTFMTPFSRIGATPEACSSYLLPKIMGYAKASEMLLFNRKLSAQEAYVAGLVASVFPKETFNDEVQKRITEFLDNPPKSYIHGKELIRGPERARLLEINENEVERLIERYSSPDAAEQTAKFVMKRNALKEQRRKAKL